MFQKIDFGPTLGSGAGAGTGTLWLNSPAGAAAKLRPAIWRERPGQWRERVEGWAANVELVPDLGRDIGSRTWWRGLATCLSLCGTTLMMMPGAQTIPGAVPAPLSQDHLDQFRAQMITPLALGADSGAHMGPTDIVRPLTETPERPRIELDTAVGSGDSFAHSLARSGVSDVDADAIMSLIRQAVLPDSIAAGTRLRMVLGRRPNRNVARPLEALAVRARLDLAIEINRAGSALTMTRIPIAVDDTPLRIRGRVGDGLYRAARAAGAEPSTIQAYLKVLAGRLDIGTDIKSDDQFDIVVAHRHAATGETETGALLYAGLTRGRGKDIAMLKWQQDGRDQWFEASGVGERKGVLAAPVNGGRISSNYGQRMHPLLGFMRMHAGVDIAAAYGSPIYAVTDGTVNYAGWHGGHGNYVKLAHSGGLGTGYGHMSRIAVKVGQRVHRGQVIGYVGSTGISTGPHLHYELFRNGATVNPLSVKFTQAAQLSGQALAAFRARLSQLTHLPAGLRESVVKAAKAVETLATGQVAARSGEASRTR